jgi:hypothetical protein
MLFGFDTLYESGDSGANLTALAPAIRVGSGDCLHKPLVYGGNFGGGRHNYKKS